MPVICAEQNVSQVHRRGLAGSTYHNHKGIPAEEASVEIRYESDGQGTYSRRDVALAWEFCASEVIARPANGRNSDEQNLRYEETF